MSEALTVLLTPAAIVALTNLFKAFGVTGRWSMLVAIVLGVGLHLAVYAWGATEWFEYAVNGLLAALSASGLYDLTNTVGQKTIEDAIEAEGAQAL